MTQTSDRQILTREYSLAEVLGMISGYLLEDRGFGRIHELIEWVVGGPVFTHQIPSVAPYVQKGLVKQFPQLDSDTDSWLADRVVLWVAALKNSNLHLEYQVKRELKERYGDSFRVAPLQPFDELEIPPLITDEIRDKVTIIQVSGDDFPEHI